MANLHYGQLYKNDKYVRMRYRQYLDLLGPYLKEGSKVLEIGCYAAEFAELLPKGIHYLGVDFDEGALAVARSKGFNVSKADFNTSELAIKDKFDIIIIAETLEHLLDPQRLMEQLSELLNKEGVVLVSLPNENTLYHRLMSLFGLGPDMLAFRLYKHLHFPTIAQSKRFITEYLEIIKRSYYINPGAKGSRFEALGRFLAILPDTPWKLLAAIFPGLFARGVIFLCKLKNT